MNLPKYLVVVSNTRDARSSRAHRCQVGPLICIRIVHLDAVHALLSIEASRDVYFIYSKKYNYNV